MAKENRLPTERVNWFDGQRVTETDLDVEQIYVRKLTSELALDISGSGVVETNPFEGRILLDTRYPGKYSDTDNPSKIDIEAGNYDGRAIFFDRNVSDAVRGNRIELELADSLTMGNSAVKVILLGRSFNGTDSKGILVTEHFEFRKNEKQLSRYFYRDLVAIYFNNFSGGTGKTEHASSAESLDLISSTGGHLLVRESAPLSVFPATKMSYQDLSPNIELAKFITSDTANSITDEIEEGLGSSDSIGDLYLDLAGTEPAKLEAKASTAISYGQKFLAKSNNIQKVDILLSVEKNLTASIGTEFDWSGELVISIHALEETVSCATTAVPDDLINFDPEVTPLLEVAFSQDDLKELGYEINDTPEIVSFNFAGTLIAAPHLSPNIEKNKYYSFIVSRRGDNRSGTVLLNKGYSVVTGKNTFSAPLSIAEEFGKETAKYFEYDPSTKRYVNDSSSSLWYIVHSDSIEVTDGSAYADNGVAVNLPKTEPFVGSTEISFFANNIPLATVLEGEANYVVLSNIEEFASPNVHPRTNDFVFTRIKDIAGVSVIDANGLTSFQKDFIPLLLARVKDQNVRDATPIIGKFSKPGLVDTTKVIIENPTDSLLSKNLIGRVLIPDTECVCTARYRIIKAECLNVLAGDLDRDNKLTSDDLLELLEVTGNTINSEDTERSILSGTLDIVDFLISDLNDDESVDGDDIELLEDAIDGYINFTKSEEIKFLVLHLENILSSSDYPEIYTDSTGSGVTTGGSGSVTVTLSEKAALMIRAGDKLTISTGDDANIYSIKTKTVASDNLTVTFVVTNLDGSSVTFTGTSGFDSSILSGTAVNLYADNNDLLDIPFQESSYEISFVDSPFSADFIDVCDLRRFISSSFIEEKSSDPCECAETECPPADVCSPVYKNQHYINGDIYLPGGNILSSPGIPHHGDYEYSNISITLPPGSIDDCAINLYNTFIKAEDSSCKTAAGYPAMKYSDGTYVGCDDDGSDTDLAKNRVKLSCGICSLYVDSLIDGYGLDGYADASQTTTQAEAVSESFNGLTYRQFSAWNEDPGNNIAITNIAHGSGANTPAIFDLTTSSDSGIRYGRLNSPLEAKNFVGDFIVDFSARRTKWNDLLLTSGLVESFGTVTINNLDNTTATLKLGWRLNSGAKTQLFFSGVIEDEFLSVLSTFNYVIDAPDSVGDNILFRLRRENDVVKAYYLVPGKLLSFELSSFGGYERIGGNPSRQPGKGSASFEFEISQAGAPNPGKAFFVTLSSVSLLSEYSSDDDKELLPIGRNGITDEIDRATFTLPINITSKTSIVDASLIFTAKSAGTISGTFNIIPFDMLNLDNIGSVFNFPLEGETDKFSSFIPGTLVVGEEIKVDITSMIVNFLSTPGYLPGQIKGFLLEPDALTNSSFVISNVVSLEINYEDVTTGVIFKIGTSLDISTGILTLNTKNILYDELASENRTVLNFGIYLKKAGFRNSDIAVGIKDLDRIGIGTCTDSTGIDEDDECFFIVGDTSTGTFVQGPFPCQFSFPSGS